MRFWWWLKSEEAWKGGKAKSLYTSKNPSDAFGNCLNGNSIALTIRSFDPLECGDWTHYDSIDIALRWSARGGKSLTKHFFKPSHKATNECCLLNELYRQG